MSDQPMLEHDWFPRPLPANAVVADGCYIHSAYSFLHYRSRHPCGIRIGRYSGVYFETFFDLGPQAYVEVGEYSTLAGPIISTNGPVIIGSYVLISREVIIADSPFARPPGDERVPLRKEIQPQGAEIIIGDNAWIGTRAMLLAGARIGEGAIVGAGSLVDFRVPDYAVVAGNPAKIVSWARPGDDRRNVE